jgi:hypothetical protein
MSSLDIRTTIGRKAEKIITSDTTWKNLYSQMSFDTYRARDGYRDSDIAANFRPVFCATLWAVVEDESLSGIPHRLENQPELAKKMGFEPDNLPSESTFKPCRLKKRFDDLWSAIKVAAKEIKEIATDQGAPIGCDLTKIVGNDDKSQPSERTEDRMLRRKRGDVLDELKSVAIPTMELPRPDEAIYEDNELLVLAAIAAIKNDAANGAGKTLGDKKNPEPNLDDPYYEDGPSGETLLETVKEMSVDEIAEVMNFALKKTYKRAEPKIKELEHTDGSRFGVRQKVAIDVTYVAYYGDREELEWVQGTPDNKSYNWCHKFATAVIVGENTHYVVGVAPLGSTEYADTNAHPGADNSYYPGDVVRCLVSIANEYVNIEMLYADREFATADVIHFLGKKNFDYVIPASKNNRLKRKCNNFDSLKMGYDEPNDRPLYIDNGYTLHGAVRHSTTNTTVSTSLIILPPDEDDDVNEDDSPQPFYTSIDMSDETALDRRWATEQIEKYSDRAAIENSYSSIKEAAAWTSSKEIEVRWFHFAFGCLVYNMWLLVDFLIQERIGVIETRKKPRVRLSRFLDWLERELVKLI